MTTGLLVCRRFFFSCLFCFSPLQISISLAVLPSSINLPMYKLVLLTNSFAAVFDLPARRYWYVLIESPLSFWPLLISGTSSLGGVLSGSGRLLISDFNRED